MRAAFCPGMHAQNVEPICIRLAVGVSATHGWLFAESDPDGMIVLGASESCDWSLAGRDLRGRHLEIYWHRNELWVRPTAGAPCRIDGKETDDWTPLRDGSVIALGGVILEVSSIPDSAPARHAWPTSPLHTESQHDDDERTGIWVKPRHPLPARPSIVTVMRPASSSSTWP